MVSGGSYSASGYFLQGASVSRLGCRKFKTPHDMKYLIALVFVVFCAPSVLAQTDFADRLHMEEKSFRASNGTKVLGLSGTLAVPENRNNPGSETLQIGFVRLKSKAENPQAPLVYLAGGPGVASTWHAEEPRSLKRWLPYLELGDVILVDQRGTGAGQPRVLSYYLEGLPEDVLVSADRMQEYYTRLMAHTQQDFAERGVDLAGYTTVQNAQDIDELRQALGIEKVSLYGFSYGTHLGQAYMKYYGDHVENAVLIGVEGLNHTVKLPMSMDLQFQKLAQLVAADPEVSQQVPDLMALYRRRAAEQTGMGCVVVVGVDEGPKAHLEVVQVLVVEAEGIGDPGPFAG